jgi:hypothetical protein
MSRRKRIEIKESEIPYVEVRVLTNDYKPVGDYSLSNFLEKYRGV